jgi:hypothetical protein
MKSYEQQKCIANNYWLLARKADPMAASVLAAINGSNSIFSVVYEYTGTGVKEYIWLYYRELSRVQ